MKIIYSNFPAKVQVVTLKYLNQQYLLQFTKFKNFLNKNLNQPFRFLLQYLKKLTLLFIE